MWSSVFSRPSFKRWPAGLALAVLLSLLFHLMILGSEYWHLPSLDFAKQGGQAQKVQLLAASVPAPVASVQPKPQPEKPKSSPKPVAPLAVADEPVVYDGQEVASPEPVAVEQGAQFSDEQTGVPSPAEEQVQEPSMDASSMAEEVIAETHAQPTFSYIDTEFVVLRGENGSKIGVTNISYRMQEDGRYELISATEAKGLAALVVSGKLLQQSEGAVSEHGLRPERFVYQYGKGDNKKQQSRFDWEQRKLTLETAKGVKTVDLPEGTQDILSFMYQFIFAPPLEQMNLSVSNGKKLSEYNYNFEGEETLNTEFGAVRTWHIAKTSQEGSEKTELWLAVDYHYLPVKMRKTEEDGSVIEQVAVQISTDLLK